ncbi:MAG: YceI family protein [Cyclobacteriaceae bacterium]|nr:YceI family protein [Cyclobacteriaceae bacterium]
MKKVIFLSALLIQCATAFAQLYMTRSAKVSFFSKTNMENIDGTNNEVTSILNTGTGEVGFAVLVKSFHFDRALMEEHFNENYMESNKFPKSTFQGKITNLAKVDFKKDGRYPATVEGDLTMHGVKQHVQTAGELTILKGSISLKGLFTIKLADYKIEIPALVAGKIAETIEIDVNATYQPKP